MRRSTANKKSAGKKIAAKKEKPNPGKAKGKEKQSGLVPVTIKTHNDNKGGHPHVIVDNIGDKHVSVGLSTQAKKGKNSPNYKLSKSPLDDGKQSYMRRQGTVAPVQSYHTPRKGTMLPKDYEQAEKYGEKAKRKYLEKSAKKSSGAQHR